MISAGAASAQEEPEPCWYAASSIREAADSGGACLVYLSLVDSVRSMNGTFKIGRDITGCERLGILEAVSTRRISIDADLSKFRNLSELYLAGNITRDVVRMPRSVSRLDQVTITFRQDVYIFPAFANYLSGSCVLIMDISNIPPNVGYLTTALAGFLQRVGSKRIVIRAAGSLNTKSAPAIQSVRSDKTIDVICRRRKIMLTISTSQP